MVYTLSPTFKQFLNSVTIELFMLLTEPQLNRCLYFTVRSVVMSSTMFLQSGKQKKIRPRQLVDVGGRMIQDDEIRMSKVCICYRTEMRSKFIVLQEMRLHKNFISLIGEKPCWLINHSTLMQLVFKRVLRTYCSSASNKFL